MGVTKLTKSKKAVQFITDEGDIYQTSVVSFRNLLNDTIKGDFILLSKLPFGVSPDRFPKSEVYQAAGYLPPKDDEPLTPSNDVFSTKNQKANKEKKMYKDVNVW